MRVGSIGASAFAVPAVAAVFAEGTVPSFARLICVPVIVPFLIFAALTALFLICLVPTEFLPSFVAANAAPRRAAGTGRGSR